VENVDVAPRAPKKRKKNIKGIAPIAQSCKCGITTSEPFGFWSIRFSDKCELLIARKPVWDQGRCPDAVISKLIRDFDLTVQNGRVHAPFDFNNPDSAGPDPQVFLDAVLDFSVSRYLRCFVIHGGAC
jgi:hypothetical protein